MRHARVATRAVVVIAVLGAIGCGPGTITGDDVTGDDTSGDDTPPIPKQFDVQLAGNGVTGTQLVNFAIPLPPGTLTDETRVRITVGGTELPTARRTLARYPDGSARSIQVQLEADADALLAIELDVPGAAGPELVPVSQLMRGTDDTLGPEVWAVLPSEVLAGSGVVGPVVPAVGMAGTPLDAWSTLCNYNRWDTDEFLAGASTRDVWLFDRVTAMYRGYATTGDLIPLRSAYREAGMYLDGMTIVNGSTTAIAPPDANDDLKYHYSQGMAIHYLLTGDDRYREAAEAVSARVDGMWNPRYDGGDGFWTERHAGFALLAHEWAAIVSDDKAEIADGRARDAVAAYLEQQMSFPDNYGDQEARCFAHSATAHGEDFGYDGCSPWMSAILADALDAHARRVGGEVAAEVNAAIVRLARIIARDGRDATGRPYYWMGVGTSEDLPDEYEEHWGESAYIVALGWHVGGRSDASLREAADELVMGLRQRGEVGQVRSFNWQCRSAVMTPALLAP